MPVDPSLTDSIIAAAKKRYQGLETIHAGDAMPPVYRIPWDSIELNLATYGGAPMGRMIRPWGGFSSCKTLMALGLAKQAQQHRSERFPDGLTIAYYNIEGTYDPLFTRDAMGVDISKEKFIVIEGGLIEDVSRNLDAMLAARHIHIIDSVSFAQSVHGFTAPKEGRQPGFDAIAWKNALRSAEMNMDKRENMIILIDQERVDFRTGASKPAGSKVIDHASSMSLYHRQSKKLYRLPSGELTDTRPKLGNDDLTGSHRVDGMIVEIEVNKSKVCRPFGKAMLKYDVDEMAFDKMFELKKAGLFLGVIEQSGSYFKVPTSDKTLHGDPKLTERLAEDDVLVMKIYEEANNYYRTAAYA